MPPRIQPTQDDQNKLIDLINDVADLKRWAAHLQVVGAQEFTNRPGEGAIIVIPPPPRPLPQLDPPDDLVLVKMTDTRTDGGGYLGRIGYGAMTLASGNLAMPEGYTFPDEDNCVILNPPETGTSGHIIDVSDEKQRYRLGKVTGVTPPDDPNPGLRIVTLDSPPPSGLIDFIITGSTQDGTNKRWTYDLQEIEKISAGYGGWSNKSGGIVGSGIGFNRVEDMNGASGLYGNGVSSTNLTGTFDIQPAPVGVIIQADAKVIDDETTEYWFSYENGVDGECPDDDEGG